MTGSPPQGPQFQPDNGALVNYCKHCQSTYKDTADNRPKHHAPCTQCGSDTHAACQH